MRSHCVPAYVYPRSRSWVFRDSGRVSTRGASLPSRAAHRSHSAWFADVAQRPRRPARVETAWKHRAWVSSGTGPEWAPVRNSNDSGAIVRLAVLRRSRACLGRARVDPAVARWGAEHPGTAGDVPSRLRRQGTRKSRAVSDFGRLGRTVLR